MNSRKFSGGALRTGLNGAVVAMILGGAAVASELAYEVQDQLNRLGFNAGPIDGKSGRKTVSALQRFFDLEGGQFDKDLSFQELIDLKIAGDPESYLIDDKQLIELVGHNGTRLEGHLYRPTVFHGKSSAIVLLHGSSGNAEFLATSARRLSEKGFTVLAMSMRGSGLSQGEDDCGLLQHRDIADVVMWLALQPGVDPDRILLWGYSAGAHASLLAATRTQDIAAVVSFWAPSDFELLIQTKRWRNAGRCGPDLAARSVPPRVDKISAPILLIHGGADENVPVEQSIRLHEILASRGKDSELIVLENAPHAFNQVQTNEVWLKAEEFLESRLSSNPPIEGKPPSQNNPRSFTLDRVVTVARDLPAIFAYREGLESELTVFLSPSSFESVLVGQKIFGTWERSTTAILGEQNLNLVLAPSNDVDLEIISTLFCVPTERRLAAVHDYYIELSSREFEKWLNEPGVSMAELLSIAENVANRYRNVQSQECGETNGLDRGIEDAWILASSRLTNFRLPLFAIDDDVLVARTWQEFTAVMQGTDRPSLNNRTKGEEAPTEVGLSVTEISELVVGRSIEVAGEQRISFFEDGSFAIDGGPGSSGQYYLRNGKYCLLSDSGKFRCFRLVRSSSGYISIDAKSGKRSFASFRKIENDATKQDQTDIPILRYSRSVQLRVGESQVIHGARGRCGGEPPSWNSVSGKLPVPQTGDFQDGGVFLRNSRSCNGPTLSRGVEFVAVSPGNEKLTLLGDDVFITVRSD